MPLIWGFVPTTVQNHVGGVPRYLRPVLFLHPLNKPCWVGVKHTRRLGVRFRYTEVLG